MLVFIQKLAGSLYVQPGGNGRKNEAREPGGVGNSVVGKLVISVGISPSKRGRAVPGTVVSTGDELEYAAWLHADCAAAHCRQMSTDSASGMRIIEITCTMFGGAGLSRRRTDRLCAMSRFPDHLTPFAGIALPRRREDASQSRVNCQP